MRQKDFLLDSVQMHSALHLAFSVSSFKTKTFLWKQLSVILHSCFRNRNFYLNSAVIYRRMRWCASTEGKWECFEKVLTKERVPIFHFQVHKVEVYFVTGAHKIPRLCDLVLGFHGKDQKSKGAISPKVRRKEKKYDWIESCNLNASPRIKRDLLAGNSFAMVEYHWVWLNASSTCI